MTTLFGVPLFGTLFVPLAVGLVTIFLFWTFVLSKKSLQSTVPSEELQELNVTEESPVLKTKGKAKEKKKCGTNGGCCSKKDGKSGVCSSNKAIETAKVFVDRQSDICQEFASALSHQLSANLTTEQINVLETESVDLSKYTDGSLCVFLTDTSEINEQSHWIQKALSCLAKGEKPLAGMKYSAFTIRSLTLGKTKDDATDQLLHKSGAVRVCRAETADSLAAVGSNIFDDWAEELLAQVQRWNTPKKKTCKCGPKRKTDQNEKSCSSSSNCSESEDEDTKRSAEQILDLEDIAKLL